MNQNKLVEEIQNIIKYEFKNKIYLKNSITHPGFYRSYTKSKKKIANEFERLEFLGDRVLGLIVASMIYNKFNDFNEGDLSKKFSFLVQGNFLYKIALSLKLDKYLNYSKQKTNFTINKSILADSLESLIGAIYLDGGLKAATKFIKLYWTPHLDLTDTTETDSKTKLQEISQKKLKVLPQYKLLSKNGPPHSPTFTISLKALNLKAIIASAKSIQDAEKKAAKIILDSINE